MKYTITVIDDAPDSILADDSKQPVTIQRRTAVDFEVVQPKQEGGQFRGWFEEHYGSGD